MSRFKGIIAKLDVNQAEVLNGKRVQTYEKRISEIHHCFKNETQAKASEAIAYTVHSVNSADSDNELNVGVTTLEAITIDDECNMTRGHYHLDRRYGEVYLGLSGTGLLLMWDGENKPYFEEVEKGSVHIIDGKYAHRLINTGNTQLKVAAIWSKHAGHNYEEIEERIFPVRVFKRNNGIEIEDIDG